MGYAIVTDSTADLDPAEAERRNITVIPLTILLDGKEYRDQVDITADQFYDLMIASDNLPTTAQPSPYDFAQLYKKLAQEGADHIISIHIAGVLSGTAQAAKLGAEQAGVPVTVIDSCGVTTFTGLLVLYAAELRDQGVPLEEAIERIHKAICRMHFLIAPETLENLLKGGRLSPLEAKAAGMLNVKPLISFDEKGTLKSVMMARGMKGVVKKMAKAIEDATAQEGRQRVYFTHTRNDEELNRLKAQLEADGVDYADLGTAPCGATVATHLGMGGVGFASLAIDE